jgi:hypothetical protein
MKLIPVRTPSKGLFKSFRTFSALFAASNDEISQYIGKFITEHLQSLKNSCRVYFLLPGVNK